VRNPHFHIQRRPGARPPSRRSPIPATKKIKPPAAHFSADPSDRTPLNPAAGPDWEHVLQLGKGPPSPFWGPKKSAPPSVGVGARAAAVVVDPATGRRAPWVPVSICSLLGAVSVCGVKLVALAARLSLSGAGPQFASPAPWLAAAFTAAAVAVQLAYLNRALDAFPAALVTPLYYALFTGGTLTAAACLYGGRVASVMDGVFLVAGLATVVTAVVLLHSTEGGGGGGRETREVGLSGGDRTAREVGLSVVA